MAENQFYFIPHNFKRNDSSYGYILTPTPPHAGSRLLLASFLLHPKLSISLTPPSLLSLPSLSCLCLLMLLGEKQLYKMITIMMALPPIFAPILPKNKLCKTEWEGRETEMRDFMLFFILLLPLSICSSRLCRVVMVSFEVFSSFWLKNEMTRTRLEETD